MNLSSTLIIGAGQAGLELAAALRAAGSQEPITLLGSEEHLPYQRPPLSKGYLSGASNSLDSQLRSDDWFAEQEISILTGRRVESLAWKSAEYGEALDATGTTHKFTSLALATGANVRKLQVPGSQLRGMHYLRTKADADGLATSLTPGARIVIVGGGFIGLEIASTAMRLGCHVTVLEVSDRLIGRAVCEETSKFYAQALRSRGIEVHTKVQISAISGTETVSGVQVIDSAGVEKTLEAAAVVVGIGVVPETSLAEKLGLDIENGILVDTQMLASDGRTVAIGDGANMPFPGLGRTGFERIRLESVPNAIEQARVAAATLTGARESYSTIPWFWSDQGSLKLQIAGLSHGYDQTVLRGNIQDETFSILYFREGVLLAADCVNQPKDFMAVKMALAKGISLDPWQAMDSDVALRDLLKSQMAMSQ
ncbi:FAD-dependent oxidoreductase [Glutamicibacter sp. MNS18]|uniref:NAD(P)/FAD-dependent oxidoreductase n=1 Tax=Glutamicibacter sp. MNS18 TaxID=2989817 RepID=UPI002235FE0F|nr:FAD-dependent oxidoreductase [Glutamicibacter sp. MNS18]MCW4466835.1 FAD-dependent oxidoreductase [Glutamicibacter sp. MNS18]